MVVVLDGGQVRETFVAPSFRRVKERATDCSVIGVDMPVGLVAAGWRECDAAVRAVLGERRASVFPVPPRPALERATYAEALAVGRELCEGKGFSLQVFNLAPKILEVDGLLDETVYEVHPELSFCLQNGGVPLAGKKSPGGSAARRALLTREGIELPAKPPPGAARDDLLDAAAAAWSAGRIARGAAEAFPAEATQRDPRHPQRALQIWG